MKPVDVKSSTYVDFNEKNYGEELNFDVGDHVRMFKYKKKICKSLRSDLV